MRRAWIFLIAAPLLTEGPLALSLKHAVQIAVSPEGNANIQLSAESRPKCDRILRIRKRDAA